MDDLGEIIAEFLVESHENLDQLDRDLIALEQQPGSRELLSSIFRTIHTIKGTSGFLAFDRLERLTHAGESLLARLRDGTQASTPATTDALLRLVDTVRVILASVERDGTDAGGDIDAVIAVVDGCVPEPPSVEPVSVEPVSVEPALRGDGAGPAGRRGVIDSSIRVDVDLLDTLMRLVGELVLTRNQLIRSIAESADPNTTRTAQRLNLITGELQEGVMKTRMQAIDHLWSKLPRLVRDLCNACDKRVRLVMVGQETELDRSLIEAVKDPLTHLVRNAIDHGIETPAERAAAGKDPEGVLALRAFHEGGHVIVEIADDGAGIDPERIATTALRRGAVTAEQLRHLDRREILALVFRPGFSTAAQITSVSGRGVGMDVVKTNIEHIGGTVDVESTIGLGTTWRLTIPLTLAIIQALTVECAGQRYVIPQVAVHELVYLDGQAGRVIEYAMDAPVYRLRGKLLPLIHLATVLEVSPRPADREVYVAVLQGEGRRFGLVVDRVLNTEEVVVKPLTARCEDIGMYAGATILGDGRVALILDVAALARRSHLGAGAADRVGQLAAVPADPGATVDRLLIVGVADRRVAIPLDLVTRLEEFPVSRIERVGSRRVVQYRDRILPVVHLAELLGVHPASGTEAAERDPASLSVVVYTEGGRGVALAVERIIDIVEGSAAEHRGDFGDDGTLGFAVIQRRVTELLDVRRAILAADPLFAHTDQAGGVPSTMDAPAR